MNDLTLKELSDLIGSSGNEPFRPFAYYDKHLDCIRVQLFDCSFTEKRLNRFFTLLEANHRQGEQHAGFNIKGVRSMFERMGLPVKGVIKMTAVLDAIVQFYPDAAIEAVKRQFYPVLGEENLDVSLA
jgi:hypothetical protein